MDSPDIIDALGISMIDLQGPCPVGNEHPDGPQFTTCREIFGVCAGAALYRRTMLEQIGLFDEDFFAYYEDVDLALRACLRGWKALCVPEAIVYHGHSATLGKDSPFKTYLLERNRYYYIIKNVPRDILWLFMQGRPDAFLRNLLCLLKAGSFRQALAFLRGNLRGLAGIPGMVMKRRIIRSCGQMHDREVRKWLLK
ncbi:MAG: glycosyltransferase [Proteobacteria bacterium]|nr:glycosyltransferase [Pseudomonadota bacterium]